MPKHSDISEDEEEWLEEELSRGKGKKKSYASSEDEGVSMDHLDDFSSSGSDSDGGGRRGGRTNGGAGRGTKAAPPPLKKRKSGGGRRGSSPSDSSNDDLDADSGDGFGDDLMGDDDDRAYLSSLTEMERENILNERYEARKKRMERMELRRKLQQSKGTRASARASTAKATGAKTGVKASALSNLKAKREEKATRAKRRAKEIEDRVDVEGSSDDDSDQWDRSSARKRAKHEPRPSASAAVDRSRDDERDERERKERERRERVEVRQYPTLDEINSIRLSRTVLEKWLDQPYFEKTVPDFFVRVGIGMNREQQNAYRMAQIVAAEKGPRTYTVGKKKTQYMLKLSHGSNSKNFSIEYISNSPITMPEYERWLREVDKANMDPPSRADIDAKRKDFESTRHYIYTQEDIMRMIEEKSQVRARPVNLAATKVHLVQLREAAKDKGTPDEVAAAEAELKRFEELDQRETEKRQKKLKVGDINKRNKAKNIVDSHVTAVIEAKLETDDPFSRRPTAPTFHIFASKAAAPPASLSSSSSSSSSTEPSSAAPEAKTPVPVQKAAKGKEKEADAGKAKEKEESAAEPAALLQLHDTLDLEIDVNLDDLASPTGVTKRPAVPSGAHRRSTGGGGGSEQAAAKAKAISLDDYKRRRGLI